MGLTLVDKALASGLEVDLLLALLLKLEHGRTEGNVNFELLARALPDRDLDGLACFTSVVYHSAESSLAYSIYLS